jgi:hypothetical protein
MSLAKWYHHKADQFAQLAKDAAEPHECADYEDTRKFWLQLAEQAERDEEIPLKSKPK